MKGEFYKMEYDDWDEGTVDLTLEEEAAYLRLCHQMYRRRGAIPNSDRLLCALWRCHQNKARPLLQRLIAAGKVHVTPDGDLTNTRVTREVDARETLSTRRADAGHTGGIRSGHVRSKALKNNDSSEAKRSREEKKREEKKECASAPLVSFDHDQAQIDETGRKTKTDEADLFDRGKAVLGKSGGGLVKKLLTAKGGNIALARAAIEQASTKSDPREYLGAIIRGRHRDGMDDLRARGDAW